MDAERITLTRAEARQMNDLLYEAQVEAAERLGADNARAILDKLSEVTSFLRLKFAEVAEV